MKRNDLQSDKNVREKKLKISKIRVKYVIQVKKNANIGYVQGGNLVSTILVFMDLMALMTMMTMVMLMMMVLMRMITMIARRLLDWYRTLLALCSGEKRKDQIAEALDPPN